MASPTNISQLSSIISSNTALLDKHHQTNNLPSPSHFQDYYPSWSTNVLPPEIEAARFALEEATLELHDLVRGPRSILMESPNHWASRTFIANRNIASLVPVHDSISYTGLASKIGVAETAVQTLLRLAIAHRIFSEPVPGHIAHSAASRMLRENELMRKFFLANADFFPHAVNLASALEHFPSATEPTEAAAASQTAL